MKTHVFSSSFNSKPFYENRGQLLTQVKIDNSELSLSKCDVWGQIRGEVLLSCTQRLLWGRHLGLWELGTSPTSLYCPPPPKSKSTPPPLLSPNPQHPSCDHLDIKYHRPCEIKYKNHVTCFYQQVLSVHHKWNVSSMASSVHKYLLFLCHYTKENI